MRRCGHTLGRVDRGNERHAHHWPTLTVVRGPAGAGKSRYLHEHIDFHRSVWLPLRNLYHPSELAGALVSLLRSRIPNLPPILSAVTNQSGCSVDDRDAVARAEQLGALIAGSVADALGSSGHQMLLVLDGVELIGGDAAAARLLEALVRGAPDSLAIVMTTRASLPFSVDRLVAAGQCTIVDREGTRRDAAEAGPTFDHLDEPQRLAVVALAGLRDADEHELVRLGIGRTVCSELLAAGVAEPVEASSRVRLTRAVADAFAADRSVLDLESVSLGFATEIIDTCVGRGDPAGAIRAALDLAPTLLPEVLVRFGEAALDGGHARLVFDAAEAAASDGLHGLQARAAQMLGDIGRAVAGYQRAELRELRAGDAWRHGLLAYLEGQHDAALEIYGKALSSPSPHDNLADIALLCGFAGSAAWVTGSFDSARELSARALANATASGSDAALAVAHTLAALVAASDGDRVSNDWNYVRALQHAERAGDLMQIARIRSNRGSRLIEEGEYELALVELDDAVRHADLGGAAVVLALAMTNRGEALTKLGRLDDARVDLAAAVEILQRQGSLLVSYPLTVLSRLYLIRGDVEQARGAAERAISIAGPANDRQIGVAAQLQLARALAISDPQTAQSIIEEAALAEESLDAGEVWSLKASLLLDAGRGAGAAEAAERAAAIARRRHDRFALATALEMTALTESGAQAARRTLEESRALFDQLGCVLDAARVEVRLAAPSAGGVVDSVSAARLGAIVDLAQRRGARLLAAQAEAAQRRLATPRSGSVSVSVLGGFAVSFDGVPLQPNAWQSKKARDLFKMLVVLDGRPLPREVAVDRLWGDDTAASGKLSVALATVRSVLDPAKAFVPDHFVIADGEAIRCNPETVDSDLRRFHALAKAALVEARDGSTRAIELLASAEVAYTGDVLESDPYAEWSVSARESARSEYLAVTQALAAGRRNSGDFDDAVRMWLRVLEHEPYDERAHLALVDTLALMGRHGDARRRYRYYVDRMRELEIEPCPFGGHRGAAAESAG